jgi:hypothetical protein
MSANHTSHARLSAIRLALISWPLDTGLGLQFLLLKTHSSGM